MVEFTYLVTLDPDGFNNDITNDVQTCEVVDSGSGEIKSAKLTLFYLVPDGKYVSAAPVLTQFMKVRIKITDDQSPANDYENIFEIDKIKPIKNAGEGYVIDLEMLGAEQWLQKIYFAKQFRFAQAASVVEDIGDFYNSLKGTSQPTLEDHDTFSAGNNELPRWTANLYEFGVAEITCYDAMMEVVNGLGASVAAGGAADFFELYFNMKAGSTTVIEFNAFSSGGDPNHPTAGNEITITDSTSVNEAPTEGGIDASTGSLVIAWGKRGSGTLPQSMQDFHGQLEAFLLDPQWISGVEYPVGARVQNGGNLTHYTANTITTNEPAHADWDNEEFDDVQGASNGYSEWTEGKENAWQGSGSDPSGSNEGFGYYDSNMVIDDGNESMTWAIKRVNTDASGAGAGQIPSNYFWNGELYRGFRVVPDSDIAALAGDFGDGSSLDRFGVAFDHNVVQHNGAQNASPNGNLNWDVIKVSADLDKLALRDFGGVFEYTLSTTTWAEVSDTFETAKHCFHQYSAHANVAGVNSTSDGTTTYGDGSAVEVTYSYTVIDAISGGFFTSEGYYSIGAWINFSLPFPENSYPSGFSTADLYGTNSNTKREPATLDAHNMHLDREGNVGFNNTFSVDLGTIEGVQFWARHNWTDINGQVLQGDFQYRCAIYDTSDNVVIMDFVIPFNNTWEFIKLPFTNFKPYKARVPWKGLLNTGTNLFLKDIEVLKSFRWHNIKLIVIQWQEVYDDQGRFKPWDSKAMTGAFAGSATVKLAIDSFSFFKPLLKITGTQSVRLNQPPAMQFPDIDNSVQLQQIVDSQLEIEQFQHREYMITTPGRIDIPYGDTFFLTDTKLVNDDDTRSADTGGSANTIRLVNKRTVYKITKPANEGAGQFTRTITGIKRIVT